MERGGYVYIITNHKRTTFYTGVTSNLRRRINEHKTKKYSNSFSSRYNLNVLVYFKGFQFIEDAITEEKRIKAGSRRSKEKLINSINPNWIDIDLSESEE